MTELVSEFSADPEVYFYTKWTVVLLKSFPCHTKIVLYSVSFLDETIPFLDQTVPFSCETIRSQ